MVLSLRSCTDACSPLNEKFAGMFSTVFRNPMPISPVVFRLLVRTDWHVGFYVLMRAVCDAISLAFVSSTNNSCRQQASCATRMYVSRLRCSTALAGISPQHLSCIQLYVLTDFISFKPNYIKRITSIAYPLPSPSYIYMEMFFFLSRR